MGRKTNFWQSLGIKIGFYPSNILPHNFGSPTILHIIFFLIYLLCQNENFKSTTTQQIKVLLSKLKSFKSTTTQQYGEF